VRHLAEEFAVDWNGLKIVCFTNADENHLGQKTFTVLGTSRDDSVLVFRFIPIRDVSNTIDKRIRSRNIHLIIGALQALCRLGRRRSHSGSRRDLSFFGS
jgi:hypothetical protein